MTTLAALQDHDAQLRLLQQEQWQSADQLHPFSWDTSQADFLGLPASQGVSWLSLFLLGSSPPGMLPLSYSYRDNLPLTAAYHP